MRFDQKRLTGHIAPDIAARLSHTERRIQVVTSTDQQTSRREASLASWPVIWPEETEPRNPQASYYRARYYDPNAGRFITEDPLGFDSAQNNFYPYVGNSPVGKVDPFGLARCWFSLGGLGTDGLFICLPDKPGDDILIFPANSGNNGDPQHKCRNNSNCTPDDHGPIPLGPYRWGGPSASHGSFGGMHLFPITPGAYGGDGRLLTHSCPFPFGDAKKPKFCSKGCIVTTPDNIKALNNLLNKEPGSTLFVTE